MKRWMLLAALLPVTAGSAAAPRWLKHVPPQEAARENPFERGESARAAGKKLYGLHCASCHGRDAQGIGRSPALRTPAMASVTPGSLYWLLRNGELERGMPSWSQLPPQQRWQIVAYLKSLQSQQ